jgi:hypothetical protein
MRLGNLIATILLLPVGISMFLFFSRDHPKHDHYEGYLIVAMLMSIFIFIASLFYLIFSNVDYIENTNFVQWIYSNRKLIRKIAVIVAIMKVLSFLFFPKKPTPSRNSVPTTRYSLRY